MCKKIDFLNGENNKGDLYSYTNSVCEGVVCLFWRSHSCPLELEIFLNSALPFYLICWLCEIFVACLLVCQPIQLILSSPHLIWFPRMFIWRSLLKLPENHSAFSSLVDKGTHNAFARLHEEYPIKSRKLLRVLQRLVCSNNWCLSIFYEWKV